MKKKEIINDVVGKLEWDNEYNLGYKITKEFSFIGTICEVKIMFRTEEDKITANQIQKYKEITKNPKKFFNMIEEALLEYYIEYYNDINDYDEGDFDDYPEGFPEISTVEELKPLLLLEYGIYISIREDWENYILVVLDCIWDEESGLAVKIENGKIVDVGSQSSIL